MTTVTPEARAVSMSSVSSSASRVWMTSALPVSAASAIWASKARSWSARGARSRPARRRAARTSPGACGCRSPLGEQRLELGDGAALSAVAVVGALQRRVRVAERLEQLGRARRQIRVQEHREDAQALGEGGECAVELLRPAVVLGLHPRLALLDVAVQPANALPDDLERLGQLEGVEQRLDAARESLEVAGEIVVELGLRDLPVAVAAEHAQRAAGEVAELVGELRLVARGERRLG